MSCNCNPSELRKKYAGFFLPLTAPSKPEKAMEKKLKEDLEKKQEKK